MEQFYQFLNKRYDIHIKKQSGEPYPWTDDPILQKYKFTNVFREDDATTVWFRENMRDKLREHSDVILATIIFRWFNLVETGKVLLENNLHVEWNSSRCIEALLDQPQWVTGAYIIKTPNGMNKLEGVCWCIDQIASDRNKLISDVHLAHTLRCLWEILLPYPYMGPFMAYEVVTDWRHTYVGGDSEDILTWANPGPGARRGLNRIHNRDLNKQIKMEQCVLEMQQILESAPYFLDGQVPDLEMREIEHTLCEFDKYERVRLNQGKPRSIYKWTA